MLRDTEEYNTCLFYFKGGATLHPDSRNKLLRLCCDGGRSGLVQPVEGCYDAPMDNGVEKLEIKLAYLEDEVETLNGIVTGQQKVVDLLEKTVRALERRIGEIEQEGRPDRRPPHF